MRERFVGEAEIEMGGRERLKTKIKQTKKRHSFQELRASEDRRGFFCAV